MIGGRDGRPLLPFEILEVMDQELATPKFLSECTPTYIAMIRSFIADGVVERLGANIRQSHGMFEALERRDDEWDADTDFSLGATSMWCHSCRVYMFSCQTQGPTKQSWMIWSKLQNLSYSVSYSFAE